MKQLLRRARMEEGGGRVEREVKWKGTASRLSVNRLDQSCHSNRFCLCLSVPVIFLVNTSCEFAPPLVYKNSTVCFAVLMSFLSLWRNLCLTLRPGCASEDLLLLWKHECDWVYGRRLIDSVDRERFQQAFLTAAKKRFIEDEKVSTNARCNILYCKNNIARLYSR